MSKAVISKRYAEALFQLGKEKSTLDFLDTEFQIVKEVFQANEKLLEVLSHPKVNNDKKTQLIKDAFNGFSKDVVNTLLVLVERNNQDAVVEIVDQFAELVNKNKGIAEAKVYSVRELSDQEKQQLSDVFSKKLNITKLRITNIVDASLLGGVKLKIGNTVYDGSLLGKLQRIERNIVSANF